MRLDPQSSVEEMMRAFEWSIPERPEIPEKERLKLRCKLILEECLEFIEASGFRVTDASGYGSRAYQVDDRIGSDSEPHLVGMVDALGDLLVVVYGGFVDCGVVWGPVFDEIQMTNFAKVKGGVQRRADGKIMKPANWAPPDIRGALMDQGWEG